ncbi:lytic transglycosylase domain-containing protein [Deinococcus roseus]|uniref:Transglycosylase SLT domain-containing protein n=1 Tax=Deinococcus roseus TaxID=392414 RepID=A0ABQ2DAZ2_9DEIO|nr:lytic transglycosylase domain-containing protein [Deinococcus roseus]GGJ48219.1 hypothetical protein GCM10008938_37790 [Deinococcus roseus]
MKPRWLKALATTIMLGSLGGACGYVPFSLYQRTWHYAQMWGLDGNLLTALIWQESRYCVDAVSPKGAYGLGQLMPGTAREMGLNRYDVDQNIFGAARYLRGKWDEFKNWNLALAAYNAGSGAVQKYGGVPPYKETQEYVSKVLGTYEAMQLQGMHP